MPSLDLCLVARIVRDGGWSAACDIGVEADHLFDDGQKVFAHVRDHVAKYGKVPDPATIARDTGVAVPDLADAPEPIRYYLDKVRARALDRLTTQQVKAAVLALDRVDVPGAVDAARTLLAEVSRQSLAGERVYDWTRGTDERWAQYQRMKAVPGGVTGVPIPWPILNAVTQGINPGDLWILVGRMGTGKSWLALKMAVHAWLAGARPLFVTMEMPRDKIERRLDAIFAKLPYGPLRRGALGMHIEDAYQQALQSLGGYTATNPFQIATRRRVKTPRDIAVLIAELHPAVVFVDGIYKMLPSRGAKYRAHWERVMDLFDEVQDLGLETGVPIVGTTQFNRQQTQKGKGGKPRQDQAGLEDLAFTDAIGMNADVVLAALHPDEIRPNKEILLRLLKNREDERKAVTAKFDLDAMSFDEVAEWGGGAGVGGGDAAVVEF